MIKFGAGHCITKIALALMFLLMFSAASMALPNLLNVQGKLTNINDEPLVGEYTFTFRIYNAETGGMPLWAETKLLNTTSQGLFSTLLGTVTTLNLNFSENYFVEVVVNGEILVPRYTVGSTSYSFKTNMTDFVSSGGVALGNFVVTNNLTVGGKNLYVDNNTGRVGIGTTGPQSKLELIGNLNVTGNAYVLSTPTAGTSNGTLYLGKTSGGFKSMSFDTTLGSSGKFVFSAPLQVAAHSPAIMFYDPDQPDNETRMKSIVFNATATFPISFSTGVEINGSLSVLGASPATITFGSGSSAQTLQFDPNSQEFKFSGGKIKQDFSNLIKNGGFESFSGGTSGGSATTQNFYGGEYQGITPDGWEAPISATTAQYAPSSYSIGSDIYQGYNSLRLYPLSELGKIRQTFYSYQLQPNKTYSVGVWVKTFTTASTAKLDVTGTALLNDFTEQTTTTNSSWTQLKGQFSTKSTLTGSDSISIELIAAGSSSYPVLFDAVQLNMGNVLGEYQDTPITGVGDQTIYGGLRLQRTGYGRGGVLSVDTAVRTRRIEFSYNTDPGYGNLDTRYMNDPRYNWTSGYSFGTTYLELGGDNSIRMVNPNNNYNKINFNLQNSAGPVLSADYNKQISISGTSNSNILNVTDGTRSFGIYAGTMSGNEQGVSMGTMTNNDFRLYSNNIDRMTIDNTGNVGIGTTTPSSKLDISGSAQVASGGSVFNVTNSGTVMVLI